MESFYKDLNLNNVEIAIASETFHISSGTAKFYLPALMPYTSNTTELRSYPSSKNIVNKVDNLGIESTNTFTGYIDIPIHSERLSGWDEYGYIAQGTQFMVVFVGGDITKPRILGRY